MMIKKIFMLSISAILLQACQTTNEQTDPVSVYYQNLIANNCVLTKYRVGDESAGSTQNLKNSAYIHSVVEGAKNWRRIDASTKGYRGSFYHNTASDQMFCSFKGWQKRGMSRDIFAKTTPVTSVK